jgi:transposase
MALYGGKPKLLGISKAGDSYLRTLLIHGARSVIFHSGKKEDRRSRWIKQLIERRGLQKANVALANKNARLLCRILVSPDATFTEDLIT